MSKNNTNIINMNTECRVRFCGVFYAFFFLQNIPHQRCTAKYYFFFSNNIFLDDYVT